MLFLVAPGFAGEVGCARGGTGSAKKSPALVASQDRAPSCFVLQNETEVFKMQLSKRGLQRGGFRFHPKGLKSSKLLMKQAGFFFPKRLLLVPEPAARVLPAVGAGTHPRRARVWQPARFALFSLGKKWLFLRTQQSQTLTSLPNVPAIFFLIPFPSLCMCVLK